MDRTLENRIRIQSDPVKLEKQPEAKRTDLGEKTKEIQCESVSFLVMSDSL